MLPEAPPGDAGLSLGPPRADAGKEREHGVGARARRFAGSPDTQAVSELRGELGEVRIGPR